MGRLLSRTALAVLALLAALGCGLAGPAAAQAMRPPLEVSSVPATAVDGFTLTHLPPRLGPRVSDFGYKNDGVAVASKVWESGSDAAGYRVDLDVHVLRSGERLPTIAAVRSFLAGYLDRDPADWRLSPVDVGGQVGYLGAEDVFWLACDGVAIWVSAVPAVGRDELLATARGVRPG
ncbi:MAG: hypothetical protein J2P24_09430 [Streptosporangiales bacterium]|nr:hypothetical protein [Streptosporangiales bacterium]MBO0891749.1 hypothetical protein [Acidothermales bacterium]